MPTEKLTTEKGKRRIRREMLSPYEMKLGSNGLRHERTAHDFGAVTRGVVQDRQEAHEHRPYDRRGRSRLSVAQDRADRLFTAEREPCGDRGHVRGHVLLRKLGRAQSGPAGSVKRPVARWPVASFQSHVLVRAAVGDEGRRKQEGTSRDDAVGNPEGLVAGS